MSNVVEAVSGAGAILKSLERSGFHGRCNSGRSNNVYRGKILARI